MFNITQDMINKINIKRVAKREGRTFVWIAKQLGVTPITVTYWATGKRRVSKIHLHALANLLNVPIEDFFEE